jgi:colicin import membrane protein
MEPPFKRALTISASVHVAIAIAMIVKFNLFGEPEVLVLPLYTASNAPLQASVVEDPRIKEDETPKKRKPRPKPEKPKPEPKPEPKEDPAEKLEEIKKQQIEKEQQVKKKLEEVKKQKEIAENALQLKKEKEKKDKLKKEEEKKKAEAAKKKKAEELKKKKAEEAKRKKAEQKKLQEELEREAEEFDIKDELAEEADEARRTAASSSKVLTEKERYLAMIVERIKQNWLVDDTMRGKECRVRLRLASSGFVTSFEVLGGDAGICQAATFAVDRAGRFPMSEDPDVYDALKDLTITLKPELK